MTAPEQVVVNSQCVLAAAARLEHAGYEGDAAAFVEGLLLEAVRSGYRVVEPVPALRGPASTKEGRRAARELFDDIRKQQTGAGPCTE